MYRMMFWHMFRVRYMMRCYPVSPRRLCPARFFQEPCSWREMKLISQAGTNDRAELRCRVLYEGRQRDFLGFRRASHAVIEAAILATRRTMLHPATVLERLIHYGEIVEKTGDDVDRQAFQLVYDYVQLRGE